MNRDLYKRFIERLIEETMDRKRNWLPIQPTSEEENSGLYYALFESEFHQIKYDESYYLQVGEGYIFLIGEWFESGRDGTTFDGYDLYVQPVSGKPLTLVARETQEVYRLKNAIEATIEPDDSVVRFISNFLDS